MKKLLPLAALALLSAPAHAVITNSTDAMTDVEWTHWMVESDRGSSQLVMGARCIPGNPGSTKFLIMNKDGGIRSNYSNWSWIDVRWNDGKIWNQYWSGSSDGFGAFSTTGLDFLQAVHDNDSVRLGFTDRKGRNRVGKFDLKAHRKEIRQMLRICTGSETH